MRVANFIDGAYLNKILEQHYGRGQVKHDVLATQLADGVDLLRSYYYDAPPWQDSPPPASRPGAWAFSAAVAGQYHRIAVRLRMPPLPAPHTVHLAPSMPAPRLCSRLLRP